MVDEHAIVYMSTFLSPFACWWTFQFSRLDYGEGCHMDMGCSLLSEVAIWFLLDIYLQVELMDHMVVLFWIFRILCFMFMEKFWENIHGNIKGYYGDVYIFKLLLKQKELYIHFFFLNSANLYLPKKSEVKHPPRLMDYWALRGWLWASTFPGNGLGWGIPEDLPWPLTSGPGCSRESSLRTPRLCPVRRLRCPAESLALSCGQAVHRREGDWERGTQAGPPFWPRLGLPWAEWMEGGAGRRGGWTVLSGSELCPDARSQGIIIIILNTNNSVIRRSLSLSTPLCCMQLSTTHRRLTAPRGGGSSCLYVMQNLQEAAEQRPVCSGAAQPGFKFPTR